MASEPYLVFLDASVLVAASRSPSGGSASAMGACQESPYRAALSSTVLQEARVNIAEKFEETELLRFYRQLAALDPRMVGHPSREQLDQCASLTGEKDAHVLAAALGSGAAFLLTLDRRHLLTPTVEAAGLPVRVMTPGDFLRQVIFSDST